MEIKKYLKKYVALPAKLGLAALMFYSMACQSPDEAFRESRERVMEENKTTTVDTGKSFSDWGTVDELTHYFKAPLTMKLGDLDGDGDLDIVVGTSYGEVRIYENRISQKK